MEFVVGKVSPGRVFLAVLQFPPVSIIPPLFPTHFIDMPPTLHYLAVGIVVK